MKCELTSGYWIDYFFFSFSYTFLLYPDTDTHTYTLRYTLYANKHVLRHLKNQHSTHRLNGSPSAKICFLFRESGKICTYIQPINYINFTFDWGCGRLVELSSCLPYSSHVARRKWILSQFLRNDDDCDGRVSSSISSHWDRPKKQFQFLVEFSGASYRLYCSWHCEYFGLWIR